MRLFFPASLILVSLSSTAFAAKDADISIGSIYASCTNRQEITTTGTVIDAFADDVDAHYTFFLLKDGEYVMPICVKNASLASLKPLIDAHVRLTGFFSPDMRGGGDRVFAGPFITCLSLEDIYVLDPPPADPYDIPELENIAFVNPFFIMRLGKRKISGITLAAWGDHSALIALDDNRLVKIETAQGQSLPHCGARILAAGHPVTDQFRINLKNAIWSETAPRTATNAWAAAQLVTPDDVLTQRGKCAVNISYYGRAIRMTGTAIAVPPPGDRHSRALLNCEGHQIAVDRGTVDGAFVGLHEGCLVEVSGICLFEAPDWTPFNVFPCLGELTIVLRKSDDIIVLSHPTWWTVRKILWITAFLFASCICILIWNISLRRLVAKKGRLLVREEVAAIKAELRTAERTHLAIELHDTISQSLTGISLQTKTISKIARTDLPSALHQLDLVQKSLGACREELRNCLWDLRNDASGRTSLDEAIRITLQPLIGDTRILLRFNVNRNLFTESTVSALLRIIRELVVNSIRHGHAKTVKVAGCLDGGKLMFSVSDDGEGFDPESAPGMGEGHFGLQGIRERIGKLHGSLSIKSAPGKGTQATVHFTIPTSDISSCERK